MAVQCPEDNEVVDFVQGELPEQRRTFTVERANVRLALAMVLDAQGHASQARELASRAAQELEGTGRAGEHLRERVAAYLAPAP